MEKKVEPTIDKKVILNFFRTVASTNMNATSSRAHTIVGITFIQKSKNDAGKEMAKGAVINLVDLAGRFDAFLTHFEFLTLFDLSS